MIAVSQGETLAAIPISIDNYNFMGVPDLEVERRGLEHVHLQEVGTNIPLLSIANSTYQQQHTQEKLYKQSQ